jgi:RNA polymerase sigma factor (sigma-70 family)
LSSVVENTDINQLVAKHYYRVRSIALSRCRSLPSYVQLDDLISYGTIGLIRAAKNYDPSRGFKFATYATFKINGAISDGLRDTINQPIICSNGAIEIDDTNRNHFPAPNSYSPDYEAERRSIREEVQKAIESLPKLEREIITLNDLQGLTQLEISKRLHLSEAWICITRRKGLKLLKEKLKHLENYV